jgi:hypothetical protein
MNRKASMMTTPKIKVVVSRAARCTGALICAAAFGLWTGVAHAQTPFNHIPAQDLAGPPGTIIRSEPMLFAPAGAQAYGVLYRSTGLSGEPVAVSRVRRNNPSLGAIGAT